MAKEKKARLPSGKKVRTVLVILSNRFQPSAPPIYFEIKADEDGTILEQKQLTEEPKDPRFDEVWINDEGKKELEACTRMKRVYGHKLERRRT